MTLAVQQAKEPPETTYPGRTVAYRVWVWLIGLGLSVIMRLWAATWRKDTSQLERLDLLVDAGDRVLAVFWHGKYFPLFAAARGRDAVVFTARSFRGDVIAQICRRFGYRACVIPGKRQGLEHMERALGDGSKLAALALDGPVGPFHRVRSGALRIARDRRFRILPLDVVSQPKFVLKSRWDRHELPLPFAAVKVLVGDPIDVPGTVADDDLDDWRAVLKERMALA